MPKPEMADFRPDRPSPKRPRRPRGEAGVRSDNDGDLTPVVGTNLHRHRVRRGLSLDRLSRLSGVSRAMLSQIELGRSTPTINVLWRISKALELPFSALIAARPSPGARVLRQSGAKVLSSHDGTFTSRALFPFDESRRTEFYELRLTPGGREPADPHPPGTVENLVIASGRVVVEVNGTPNELSTGDTILFQADVPHSYSNPGPSPAVMYLVMTYAETIG
jgi:transcriptional regulator with XRE-family HTH domain